MKKQSYSPTGGDRIMPKGLTLKRKQDCVKYEAKERQDSDYVSTHNYPVETKNINWYYLSTTGTIIKECSVFA